MAGKSRQPSHEPPRQARGPPSRLGIAQRKGGLMAEQARAPKRNWYSVVEPHSTRDIEMLFKLIVKVPVIGNTAGTPNPPGLLPS